MVLTSSEEKPLVPCGSHQRERLSWFGLSQATFLKTLSHFSSWDWTMKWILFLLFATIDFTDCDASEN